MKSRKKYLIYLFIFLLSAIGFFLLINTFEPSKSVDVLGISVLPEIPFFILLLVGISCLGAFALANSRRGLLAGFLVTSIAILQYFKVNNIFYMAIVTTIVVLVEFLFWKKKETK